jgi:hypothetical protein
MIDGDGKWFSEADSDALIKTLTERAKWLASEEREQQRWDDMMYGDVNGPMWERL